MCGIFGIGFLSKNKNPKFVTQLITELLNEVKIRGTDAAGVAFISNTKIHVIKDGMSGESLSKSTKFKNACKEMINEDLLQIIGHCRLQTKGTFLNNVNNHPIVANKIIGIHNGFVTNDDELFKQYKESATMIRAGAVDTEVIFRLIDHFSSHNNMDLVKSTVLALKYLEGSFACAFTHTNKPHILGLFRFNNPTVIRYYVKDGLIIYCSADSLIGNALNRIKEKKLSSYRHLQYSIRSALFINLQTGKFSRVKEL